MKSWPGPPPDIPSPFPSSKFCLDSLKTKGLAQHGPTQCRLMLWWSEISFPKLAVIQILACQANGNLLFYCWTLSVFQSLQQGAKAGQAGLLYDNEIYTHSSLCLERVFNSPKASGWNGSSRDCANLYTLNNFFSASAFHLKKKIIKKDCFLEIG